LHVDFATRFLLEVGDPVVGLVRLAAFDVAGPGHDIDLPLAFSDGFEWSLCIGRLEGKRRDADEHEKVSFEHGSAPLNENEAPKFGIPLAPNDILPATLCPPHERIELRHRKFRWIILNRRSAYPLSGLPRAMYR